jgi:hypothetical protein
MKPAICKVCGRAEWNHLCGVVPEDLRSSALSASPRRTDREAPDKTLPDALPRTHGALPTSIVPTPDTSDTEPSVTNFMLLTLAEQVSIVTNKVESISDDQLRPLYNEWMRRRMRRHRSG